MIYIDTSAFLKLAFAEPETDALGAYLEETEAVALVSSALLTVEARRAAHRARPRSLPRVDLVLSGVTTVQISDAVIESAGRLSGRDLRSLDAIHLATILLIREDVDLLLCYDDRLGEAAAARGVPVVAPA